MKRVAYITVGIVLIAVSGLFLYKTRAKNDVTPNTFYLTIEASEALEHTAHYATTTEALTVKQLLEATRVPYDSEMRNTEVITVLEGVLTTAQKGWNIYVNNELKQLGDLVTYKDVVEIRYATNQ